MRKAMGHFLDNLLLILFSPWLLLVFCRPEGCRCVIPGAGLASLSCSVHRPRQIDEED